MPKLVVNFLISSDLRLACTKISVKSSQSGYNCSTNNYVYIGHPRAVNRILPTAVALNKFIILFFRVLDAYKQGRSNKFVFGGIQFFGEV